MKPNKVLKPAKLVKAELIELLRRGNAHSSLNRALEDLPFILLTKKHKGIPYTIWDLVEHIRLAQKDIINFCKDQSYKSPRWPDDYWPKDKKPTEETYSCSKMEIEFDREELISLLENTHKDELFTKIAWGDGQSLFREALVLADHNSYHTGQIILLRRLFGDWE